MKTTTKAMALAMIAVTVATAPDFNDKTAMEMADEMGLDETTAKEIALELSQAKEAAENDMENEFSSYTRKDLEYLYDDLEEELFSCNDCKRETEIENLLDRIEEAMIRREKESNNNFRA